MEDEGYIEKDTKNAFKSIWERFEMLYASVAILEALVESSIRFYYLT